MCFYAQLFISNLFSKKQVSKLHDCMRVFVTALKEYLNFFNLQILKEKAAAHFAQLILTTTWYCKYYILLIKPLHIN